MTLLVDSSQARWFDRQATQSGLSGLALMEAAAAKAAVVASKMLCRDGPLQRERSTDGQPDVLVLCGRGNNGGDGLALARHLRAMGSRAHVFMIAGDQGLPPEADANLAAWRSTGGPLTVASSDGDLQAWSTLELALRARPALVVDAMLGIGTSRAPAGGVARAVAITVAARPPQVLALDVPTGLDANTGHAYTPCLPAQVTVTFGWPKIGLFTGDGPAVSGTVALASIGLTAMRGPGLADQLGPPGLSPLAVRLITAGAARASLPARPRQAHKGDAGSVVIVAGSSGMVGAAVLAGQGALRGGAGLVRLATTPAGAGALAAAIPEALTLALAPDGLAGASTDAAIDAILGATVHADAVALGPGLGTAPATVAAVRQLIRRIDRPLVLDADGLNAFAGDLLSLADSRPGRAPLVITPHPGELARLLATTVSEVQADRLSAARKASASADCVCLLKGSGTVVAGPDGRALIVPSGNPGMATGGMGDVLTGLLAALLAGWSRAAATTGRPSSDLLELVGAAALLHGVAGDLAQLDVGTIGLIAGDVAVRLPRARDIITGTASVPPGLEASLEGVATFV